MDADHRGKAIFAVGAQYFLYFGVLGIFLPYFNLYCYHIGFTGFQIGVLSGLRSVTLVVFSLIWARLADRFQARRAIYIFCNFGAASIWALFLTSVDFRFLLLVTVLYGIFFAPIISFLEALTMETLDRDKKRYGQIRAWGSISFILTVLALGRLIDAFGVQIILILILAGGGLQAVVAVAVPRSRRRSRSTAGDRRFLYAPKTLLFLGCAFLMLVSHGAYYGFYSIHLETLGYGKTFIGVTWALASGAEILAMIRSERIFKKLSLEFVLTASFGVAAIRWFLLARVSSPGPLLLAQVLHAVTYGTFHMAGILYMDRLTPEGQKTMGQAVNNAIQYGLGLMAGFFLAGWLYEPLGASGLFVCSGITAAAAGILFAGFGCKRGWDRG